MKPPGDAAASPLVGAYAQGVRPLVGKAEDLLHAVAVSTVDDLPHLMGPRVAAIAHVLKRDARRNGRRPQVARLGRAEIKDLLGLAVAGDDPPAQSEDPGPQVMVTMLKIDGSSFETSMRSVRSGFSRSLLRVAPELLELGRRRRGDAPDEIAAGVEADLHGRPPARAVRRSLVSVVRGATRDREREDALILVEGDISTDSARRGCRMAATVTSPVSRVDGIAHLLQRVSAKGFIRKAGSRRSPRARLLACPSRRA